MGESALARASHAPRAPSRRGTGAPSGHRRPDRCDLHTRMDARPTRPGASAAGEIRYAEDGDPQELPLHHGQTTLQHLRPAGRNRIRKQARVLAASPSIAVADNRSFVAIQASGSDANASVREVVDVTQLPRLRERHRCDRRAGPRTTPTVHMQPVDPVESELAVVKDGATRGRTKRENYRLEDRLM
jgi:hypothetical protein